MIRNIFSGSRISDVLKMGHPRMLLSAGILLFGGLLLGWGGATILGNVMEKQAARLWDPFSQKGGALYDSRGGGDLPGGMRLFLDKSPFGVLSRKEAPPEQPQNQKKESPLAHQLEDLQITGTVAGILALGNTSQGRVLLEQGEIFRGFLVAMITGDGVYFDPQDGGEPVIKSLLFGAQGAKASSRAPKNPTPAPQAISPARQDIKPATPDSAGQVSRNLVNSLLMNPFDELKKVRLQPKHTEGKPEGLEVAYIEQDSILATLGVRQGDVVQGLNGIRINHMGDVANAINSLMGGKRFDVTVIREGKQELLSYQVQ
jgi:type II secretory pathway component PulC